MLSPIEDELAAFLDDIVNNAGKLKRIYVFMDLDVIEVYPAKIVNGVEVSSPKYIFPVSHDSVVQEMNHGTDIIYTHDPSFFNFDTLEKGYDVIVLRNDKGVVLSQLLDSKARYQYVNREIRWEHNTYKMLMAGVFEMQPMGFDIPPIDDNSVNVLKRRIRGA
jgi:hypothetical protein